MKKVFLTEAQVSELERMAMIGMSQDQIVLIFGTTKEVLAARFRDQEGVRLAWERGKAMAAEEVMTGLWELIDARSPAAIMFWLKTQCGWRETNRLEVSGALTIEQAIKEAAGAAGASDDAEPE